MDASRPQRQLRLYHQAHTDPNRQQLQVGYLQEDLSILDPPISNAKQCHHMKKKMYLLQVILDLISK